MKKKPIQVVKAWRYPCYKIIFYKDFDSYGCYWSTPGWFSSSKSSLIKHKKTCWCGKGCKPRRIKITVEET